MRTRRVMTQLLALTFVLSLCVPSANAGLTDAIKNKVKAIKGEPKAKASTSEESGGIKSRMTPPVTAESLAKFKSAMEIEKAERDQALKSLAVYKSQDDWAKCRMEVMQSPEGMKITERLTNIGENATPEQMQKILAEAGADLEKLITAKCGPDPSTYQSRRSELMRSALAKGSDAFVQDDHAYFVWKEWVLAFCKYIEELKKEKDADQKIAKIKDEGLRVPGSGNGIYYVYTASEANALLDRCEALVPLIEATS